MGTTTYSRKKRVPQMDLSTLVYGKVPPQAKELEEAVLGALMLERTAFDQISDITQDGNLFYVNAHQLVFRAIKAVHERNQRPDLLLVVEELQMKGELENVGGPYFVSTLTNAVVSSVNIITHTRIVFQKYVMRELLCIAGELVNLCYDDTEDVFNILDFAREHLHSIDDRLAGMEVVDMSTEADNVLLQFRQRRLNALNGFVDPSAIYTGIPEWDKLNGRLQPGVYILAARPGVGKSVVAVQLVVNMAPHIPIGFINIEMSNDQQIMRIGCNMQEMPNEIWRKEDNEITEQDVFWVEKAMNATKGLKVQLCGDKKIDRICSKIGYWVRVMGVKCIIIDILTIVQMPDGEYKKDRREELNYIMGRLRDTARDLRIPIIALTHINRENEKAGKLDKEPSIANIKGSGDIEDFAVQVMILHRPEMYGVMEENDMPTAGLMKMRIVKHRNGELGCIYKRFNGATSSLHHWSHNSEGWTQPGVPALHIPNPDREGAKFFIDKNNFKTDDFSEGFNEQNKL